MNASAKSGSSQVLETTLQTPYTAPTSTRGRPADWDHSPSQLCQCSQRHTLGENVFSELTFSYHHSSPATITHQPSRISRFTASWNQPPTCLHVYLQVAPRFQDSIQPSRYDHHLSLARKVVGHDLYKSMQ